MTTRSNDNDTSTDGATLPALAEATTWLGAGVGFTIVLDGHQGEDGSTQATRAHLALVSEHGDTLPIPGDLTAARALELAQLLMGAASLLDPAATQRVVEQANRSNIAAWALQHAAPDGPAH